MLDLLFPKRCVGCHKFGQYLCILCSQKLPIREPMCPLCHRPAITGMTHPRCHTSYGLDGLVSIFRYGDLMQQIVKKLKFRMVSDIATELIDALVQQSEPWRMSLKLWQDQQYSVVPLPLHPSRERWRGFNQTHIIGKLLAKKLQLPLETGYIHRVRDTTSQAEMNISLTTEETALLTPLDEFARLQKQAKLLKQKRLKIRTANVRNAFKTVLTPTSKNLVLVDDVWTTGATMAECAKVLKKAGANQVWGLTLAR